MTLPRTERSAAASLFNLANNLTSLRLGLSIVLFFLVWAQTWRFCVAVFALAALTDWLDGMIARRQGLVSSLGRVYDPLVDKILVCGVFIFLADVHDTHLPGDAGVSAWMVTVIVTREFIVTGLRGFLEEKGVSFGADWLGKVKMVLQCAAILWVFFALSIAERGSPTDAAVVLRDVLNFTAVAVTFISGANYVRKAVTHLS